MAKNTTLTSLDPHQISRVEHDETNDAKRVIIVGGDFKLEPKIDWSSFPKQEPAVIVQKEIQIVEVPKIVTETKIERVEVPVVVKETVVERVEVPVIVKELQEIKVIKDENNNNIQEVIVEKPVEVTVEKQIVPLKYKIIMVLEGLAAALLAAAHFLKT